MQHAALCISMFLFCPCAMCDDKKLWLFLNYFAVKFTSKSGHFKHFQGQNGLILHNSIWHHSTSTEDASGCPAQNIMLVLAAPCWWSLNMVQCCLGLGGWAAGWLRTVWRVLIFNEISDDAVWSSALSYPEAMLTQLCHRFTILMTHISWQFSSSCPCYRLARLCRYCRYVVDRR